MISENSLITIVSFFVGVLVGILIDRLLITRWVDQISKRKLQLFSNAIITFVVIIIFLMLNIKTLVSDAVIDKEIYWIFAMIIGTTQGVEISEIKLKSYLDLFRNGKNKNDK